MQVFCHQYHHSTSQQKLLLKEQIEEHLKNKTPGRKLVNESVENAKSDSSIAVLHFAFQKVLTRPKCEVSNMYYFS